MNHRILASAVAGILLMSSSGTYSAETTTQLFNGTDLDGSSHVLVGDGITVDFPI